MSDLIIDSSVLAKWILPESDSPRALRLLTDATAKRDRLIVLDLALIEVSNAIWTRLHRSLITKDEAGQLLDALMRCPVEVEQAARLLKPAFDIATTYRRAVYDALFVAFAVEMSCTGVTA